MSESVEAGRQRARASFWTRVLVVVVIIVVAAYGIGQIVATSQNSEILRTVRATQLDNTQRAKDTKAAADAAKETAQRIEDCTTPGRRCYDDGQKRTATAVGNINRVVILAAACSVGLDPHMTVLARQNSIQECVIQRLAAAPR